MKRVSLFLILFFVSRTILLGQIDSSTVMSPEVFLHLVKTNHPMVRKANIKVEIADRKFSAEIGNFDPVISSDLSQKYFEQSEYYKLFGAEMKIPAWFGIEVYSGFDLNAGDYLNPERSLPENGLLYAGVSIPVGRDLFIDYRMFEFKKADLYVEASTFERQLLLNELLLDASMAYWNWYKAYNAMQIYEAAFQTASERYLAVKNSALAGDRPFIDTVEAGIHMQNRYLGFINSKTDFENKGKLVSTFLWADGFIPLEMSDQIFPVHFESTTLNEPAFLSIKEKDSLLTHHPKMLMIQNKMDYLTLEKKYRQEQLKPQLDLKYNFIAEPINGTGASTVSWNNYTWGFEFSSPLFYQQQRNELKETKLKMEDILMTESMLQTELALNQFTAKNNWQNSADQVVVWQTVAQHYTDLFQAEFQLFSMGESSLFMVNSREMDMINSKLKLIEYTAQNQISEIYHYYSLAILHQQL